MLFRTAVLPLCSRFVWQTAWDGDGGGCGEWIYPFEYELPGNIAYSTEGKYGEISYGIKVVLDIPHELDKQIRLPLTIIRYEDLNSMPLLKYPKERKPVKHFVTLLYAVLARHHLLCR